MPSRSIRSVSFDDLDFKRIPVNSVSHRGVPYLRWKCVGMPKINREFIQSVFFLYRSSVDAGNGVNAIGTGFLVDRGGEYFGVSNRHVVRKSAASFVRLNTKVGDPDIIEFDPSEWETIAGEDDIAAVPMTLDRSLHAVSAIRADLFIKNHEVHKHMSVGVGDDVFMIGLFVNHEGKEKNNPLARFGNISMMADSNSPVDSDGHAYASFIVDMHSRSGYSGSPVFVYRTFGGDLENPTYGHTVSVKATDIQRATGSGGLLSGENRRVDLELESHPILYLLGIHTGQFAEPWRVEGQTTAYFESTAKISCTDSTHIKGTSILTHK